MKQNRDDRLDRVFRALGDRTRRAMLARLATGSASVTELAAPFDMSLPAASKHLRVLESAGLVERSSASEATAHTVTASSCCGCLTVLQEAFHDVSLRLDSDWGHTHREP